MTRPPRRHQAWPTAKQAEAYAKHSHIRPIVPFAKFVVDCVCGAAFDSAAPNEAGALAEIARRHRCKATRAFDAALKMTQAQFDQLRRERLIGPDPDAEPVPEFSPPPLTATAYGDLT